MAMTDDYHYNLGRTYAEEIEEDEEEEEEEEEYEDEEDDVEPEEPAAKLPQPQSERPLKEAETATLVWKLKKLSEDQMERVCDFFASDAMELQKDGQMILDLKGLTPSRQRMLVRVVDLELEGHKCPRPGTKAALLL